MNEIEKVIKSMNFRYFGSGQHKIEIADFFALKEIIFLDIRAKEELETVNFQLKYHCPVLSIPTDEIPERINEIPKDKTIGVFCSSGVRSVIIFAYLKSKGYENVKILLGGYAPLMEALKPGKILKKVK